MDKSLYSGTDIIIQLLTSEIGEWARDGYMNCAHSRNKQNMFIFFALQAEKVTKSI